MNTTTAVKDQELFSSGLIDSASVNSITDFIPSKLNEKEIIVEKDKNEFINTFICHLIFYSFFCISIVVHILVDLGLGSFVKKTVIKLIKNGNNNFVEKNPAFA